MEHLLNDVELLKSRSRIIQHPWLGFNHDGEQRYSPALSLEDYARRRGWIGNQLNCLENDPCAFGMTGLEMLQSMLFFGVWESLTGRALLPKDFIVNSSTGPKLCTTKLRLLLQEILRNHRPSTLDLETL